jgi:hypothetical protein
MRRTYAVAAAALLPLAVGGCATVINGTSQDYQMESQPNGAKATLSNGQSCTTPCSISLKRRNDLAATVELDGYKTEKVYIQSRTGGAGVGNILLGGVIGAGVDASNGSMNSLYPRPLNVKLVANGSPDEAVLLDKKGETIGTVTAHNAKVMADVEKGLAEQQATADKKAAKKGTD